MTSSTSAKPTLAALRKQARAYDIEIAVDREASVLAGARYLYDAAGRLDGIAAGEEPSQEPACR